VTRGRLGIGIQSLTKELAQSFSSISRSARWSTSRRAAPPTRPGLLGDVIRLQRKKIED
jgi:hypothetical protein